MSPVAVHNAQGQTLEFPCYSMMGMLGLRPCHGTLGHSVKGHGMMW